MSQPVRHAAYWLAQMMRAIQRRSFNSSERSAWLLLSEVSSTRVAVWRSSSLAMTSPPLVLTTTRSPRRMLAAGDVLYPQFATHNAHTLATVMELAGNRRDLEFQRLHGMGEAMYDALVNGDGGVRCRIYAPVGSHEDLLAYLVRRLLENGANSSFVNRMTDEKLPVSEIVADPAQKAAAHAVKTHPRIPLPPDLYGSERRNSRGVDLSDPPTLRDLKKAMEAAERPWHAAPLIAGEMVRDELASIAEDEDLGMARDGEVSADDRPAR